MGICSVCKNQFEDNYFDIPQNKCLLHCDKNPEKTVKNIYYFNDCLENYLQQQRPHENDRKILQKIYFPDDSEYDSVLNQYSNIQFIACTFQSEIYLSTALSLRFYHCTFKNDWKHIICEKIEYSRCDFDNFTYSNISKKKDISKNSVLFDCTFKLINCEGVIFEKPFIQIVDERKERHLDDIKLIRCEFLDDFIINVTDRSEAANLVLIELQSIDLSHSVFHKKFKMQYCNVKNDANFYNTKFKDLADFYKTEFNKVVFERTDFEDVVVFSEVKFYQDINFKYTKFLGYSVFRDTVIKGKLDLRNTIFNTDADANFLDITSEERARDDETNEYYGEPKVIQVINRETAKIIKSFYEYSNNIIEANKFYALEMKEREKELNRDIKIGKNILEWLVFKIHSISSDHSQSWFLSLFWIIYFTFMFSFLNNFYKHNTQLLSSIITLIYFEISFIIGLLIDSLKNKGRVLNGITISFVSYFIYGLTSNDFALNCFSKNINPFSIMKGSDSITFGELIFKIVTAYLIYQFIISIRQNTRRK